MPTLRFVRSSLVTVFINPNASSPKIDLYLGIVRWRTLKDMQWASNFLWYMARPSSVLSMTTKGFLSASSSSFFSLILLMQCQNQKIELQLPGERELLPENSVKAWYQYNWGVYGEKAFTSNTQRVPQTSAGSSCCSESKLSMCRKVCAGLPVCAVPEIKLTGNLNLNYFIFQVLRLIAVKACILKPQTFVLWTPHKEHTESAIRKDHLAPCRF